MKSIKKITSYFLQALPVVLTFILLALFLDYLQKSGVQDALIHWIQNNQTSSVLLFVVSGVVLYSVAFSGNMLAAVALVLFGFAKGALLLIVAGLLSSLLVFLSVRFVFHAPAQHWIRKRPKLQRVQHALTSQGLRFYCLIRFSPFHAVFITLIMALSTMRFRDFLISLSMMLPQWLLFMYFAFLAAQSVQLAHTSAFTMADVLRFGLLVMFIVILVYVTQMAKQVIQQSQSSESH